VLGRIFGPKGEQVIGGWRKLHNEKLYYVVFTKYYREIKSRWMDQDIQLAWGR
jgi:hypothetical protein